MSLRAKRTAAAAGPAAGAPAKRAAVPSQASSAKTKTPTPTPTQSKGAGGLTIADLPDVEKEKVARLVHKLIELGQEHEQTLVALADERAKYEQHVSSTDDTVGEHISVVEERLRAKDQEIGELDTRSTMLTGLLALYQAKLKNSGDLLRYHSAAEEEGKIRTKQLESDLRSLQSLVASQKETIESFQSVGSRYSSSLEDQQREHESQQASLQHQVAQLRAQLQGRDGSVASAVEQHQMSEQLLKEKLVAADERHAVLSLQCDLLRQNLDLQRQMHTQAQATQARQMQARHSESFGAELSSAPLAGNQWGVEENSGSGVLGAGEAPRGAAVVYAGPSKADAEYADMYTSVDSISFSFQTGQGQGVDAGRADGSEERDARNARDAADAAEAVRVQVVSAAVDKQKRPAASKRVAAAVAALPMEVAQLGARMRQQRAAQAMAMSKTAEANLDLSSIRGDTEAAEDLPAVSDQLLLRSYDDAHAWEGSNVSGGLGRLDVAERAVVVLPKVAVEPVAGRGSVGGGVDVSDVSEGIAPEDADDKEKNGQRVRGRRKDVADVRSKGGAGKGKTAAIEREEPKKRKASAEMAQVASPSTDAAAGLKRREGKKSSVSARGKVAQAGSHSRPLSAPTRSSEVKGAARATAPATATAKVTVSSSWERDSHSTFDAGHRNSLSSTGSLQAQLKQLGPLGSVSSVRPTRSAGRQEGQDQPTSASRDSRLLASGQRRGARPPPLQSPQPEQQCRELHLDESFFDLLGQIDPLHAQ
ncbi:hypothetical protein B484DRAFT_446501 [Ochromonadaceae sp. CCMP2298]|nr:hypothetical protein B484DRAFT_446501 [Ochromonadaceae sp. CCMP2298]|mmetsp:Transcript_33641/g.74152  ORF Transcript_33641/g.74152 Transcript_33641/m.74152 type:complete len:762 (-) Transcript_33641:69-2354(-)